ncbi:Olfactory receptor 867 [Sciurus carolinensis]|uniref:Olfactory receptor 867 n=1 Tax=Sciurus carolinensis TaxID=30640 RepID=A0AA41MXE8_SCICA|nr:Olfactory receptor 867 [Sciurus carolinensis]
MAFDRFVAICHPLNYTVIMNPRLCGLLVLTSWIIMFVVSLIDILLMKQLTFSKGTEIPHFFCELTQILNAATSDNLINNIVMYILTALLGVIPMLRVIFSYSQVASSLLRMSSIDSKYKAFSTCGSHLCVVTLFYGTGLEVYLSSAVTLSSQRSMITSMMYTVVTPMLNPFIYSLRNKDVKGALRRLLSKAATRCSVWVLGDQATHCAPPPPQDSSLPIAQAVAESKHLAASLFLWQPQEPRQIAPKPRGVLRNLLCKVPRFLSSLLQRGEVCLAPWAGQPSQAAFPGARTYLLGLGASPFADETP